MVKKKEKKKKPNEQNPLKEWKRLALERDNYQCQICGKKQSECKLQVHHILSYRVWKEFRVTLQNALCLCFYCHKMSRGSPHNNSVVFSYWFMENKKEQYEYLKSKTNNFKYL